MKGSLKVVFERLSTPVDLLLSIAVIPAAYLLLLYRRLGSHRLPTTTARLKNIGVFPVRDHYYEPMFNDRHLSSPLEEDRSLPGIDLNVGGQIAFLSTLTCSDELIALDLKKKANSPTSFSIKNGSFESGDAEFLYQIVRKLKPKKIIEIGSGSSTKITRLALNKNVEETGQTSTHVCIEPYEQSWLEGIAEITLIRERVESCEIDWSSELNAGDLLFVDSSHIIRPQGDVLTEYLRIFPQLQNGVYVHIHDIFTPKDYLKHWVIDEVRFWNEQYLLEALLANTSRYEVIAALNFLKHHYHDDLKRVCPYLSADREPGSFYFRVRS